MSLSLMQALIARLSVLLALLVSALPGSIAQAQEGEMVEYPMNHPRQVDWTFAGPFGKFDPAQLQRGFQVYREVCSGCHALSMIAFRNLASETGPRFTEDQARALAAEYQIADQDSSGETVERPGRPSDYFPSPFPNEAAARAANGGAYPPDLSLIAKARAIVRGFPTFIFDVFTQYQETGPDYIYSLLTGYEESPPAHVEIQPGQYYNPYFISGPALAMPPPLSDGQVTYAQNADEDAANDVPETIDQYSQDVAAFLVWAAEPHLVERKSTGLVVIVFLIVLAGLVYYTKKKVWAYTPGTA